MKMRARTNDLIILTPDAYGYIEHEDVNGKPPRSNEKILAIGRYESSKLTVSFPMTGQMTFPQQTSCL